jgi:hypothetical protein
VVQKWQTWSWFFGYGSSLAFDVLRSKGLLAFWSLMFCSPKVFWQMWSQFFGHGSLLAFDVLQSKGHLADVEQVFWAW